MKPSDALLLDSAFTVYSTTEVPKGYVLWSPPITNARGIHVEIYKSVYTNDYIFSFRGSESPNAWGGILDWSNDANDGWPQYDNSQHAIAGAIDRITKEDSTSRIHLVGHSLGGALAQFAAYDFAVRHQGSLNNRITLTTWNALGAEWALREHRNSIDIQSIQGLDATHYYRTEDIVARLGGGHIGGKKIMLIPSELKLDSFISAHMKQALLDGLQTGIKQERDPAYLHFSKSTRTIAGSILGGFINALDGKIDGSGFTELSTGLLLSIFEPSKIKALTEIATAMIQISGEYIVDQSLQKPARIKEIVNFFIDSAIKATKGDVAALATIATSLIDLAITALPLSFGDPTEARVNATKFIGDLYISIAKKLKSVGVLEAERLLLLGEVLANGDSKTPHSLPREFWLYNPTLEPYGPALLPLLNLIKERFEEAESSPVCLTSPLILDLDGDGVETLAGASGIYFDHDGNRFAEQTGWVGGDDALLVWDRNRNGSIDSGAELFGNHSEGIGGTKAAHGMEALAALDHNLDGVIDAFDPAWNELALWRDQNGNAELNQGELISMPAAGVEQLLLTYAIGTDTDRAGNLHQQLGSYRRVDGEERQMTDVWFQIDTASSIDLAAVAVDAETAYLPNIFGMGNVPSLHQAMQRDSSGELRRMVEKWHRMSDEQKRQSLLPIIFLWTGVQGYTSAISSNLEEPRTLAALEALMGRSFRNGAGVQGRAMSQRVDDLFGQVSRYVYDALNKKGLREFFLSHLDGTWDAEAKQIQWQPERALQYLLEPNSGRSDSNYLTRLRQSLLSLPVHGKDILATIKLGLLTSNSWPTETLLPLIVDKVIVGSDIRQVPPSSSEITQARYLEGTVASETLYGSYKDDIIIGNGGNDELRGSLGDDIYLFGQSFGRDTIFDSNDRGESFNLVLFTHYNPADISAVVCRENRLFLSFQNGDELGIYNYLGLVHPTNTSWQSRVEIGAFQFADSSIWTVADILKRVVISGATEGADNLGGYMDVSHNLDGLAGNDRIKGSNLDDILYGNSGDDFIDGDAGNDTLRGGTGNDCLQGGRGDDRYIFAPGDGQDRIEYSSEWEDLETDTLVFEAGILPSDVIMKRDQNGYGLTICIANRSDKITIPTFFFEDDPDNFYNPIDTIQFQDGTRWDRGQIVARAMTGTAAADRIQGTRKDDAIHGLDGDDTLFGGEGKDTLHAGNGSDTLWGNSDDDVLYGEAGSDIFWGGPGNDILYGGADNNCFMFAPGDGQDIIKADNNFSTGSRLTSLMFTQEVLPQSVQYRRVRANLLVTISGSTDSILIEDFFRENNPLNAWNPVRAIYFAGMSGGVFADQIPARLSNAINGTTAADVLAGTAEEDYINGLGGNDSLEGRAGNDSVDGGDGNDTLIGGEGDDWLDGGAGIDSASYAHAAAAVRVDLSLSGAQNTGGAGVDTLVGIEDLSGSAWADDLRGNAGANSLEGGGGDDCIDGGAGHDLLRGGAHGAAGDTVSYSSAAAAVTVNLALTASQSTGGAGNDILSGFENLRGSRYNDTLSGSAGANRLEGGEGNDLLWGSDGRDHHSGGAGADQFLYRTAAEAGNGADGRDVLVDVQSGDRIDLSRIDAKVSVSGNQAFVWIGSAAFTAPGQLRYTLTNGLGLLEGNTSGTSGAEFQIALANGFALQPGSHVVL